MKALPPRVIFLCSTVILLVCATVFFIYTSVSTGISVGELETGNGQNILYLGKYDLAIKGQDKDGITYFFIPSYAEISSISQDSSMFKLFLTDGRLLTDPRPGTVQDVNIDTGNGEIVPWRVAFMCSDNLYTAFIYIPGAGADDIDHDIYLPSELRLYSPFGKLAYSDDSVLLKGRGNTTWEAVKQPYELKLSDSFPLCDMDSSSKWVLLANFFDDTKILNKMAMDLSSDIGMEYAIQSDWIDLYINGEYRGNYLLCKEPGIGKGRLKTKSGFLIEKDIRTSAGESDNVFTVGNNNFKIKDPYPLSDEKFHAISSYIGRIDSEIRDANGDAQIASIDIDSFSK
ncbi:MAG: CotH kinase family protein, partial [Lachnospiraceae bacterium]|nr:CotH kinase family protein [Lachnospiraceae bacterium]